MSCSNGHTYTIEDTVLFISLTAATVQSEHQAAARTLATIVAAAAFCSPDIVVAAAAWRTVCIDCVDRTSLQPEPNYRLLSNNQIPSRLEIKHRKPGAMLSPRDLPTRVFVGEVRW